jgi:hypothetical protein
VSPLSKKWDYGFYSIEEQRIGRKLGEMQKVAVEVAHYLLKSIFLWSICLKLWLPARCITHLKASIGRDQDKGKDPN